MACGNEAVAVAPFVDLDCNTWSIRNDSSDDGRRDDQRVVNASMSAGKGCEGSKQLGEKGANLAIVQGLSRRSIIAV